jgi:uncharacterized protein YndB with AHSA1/START domain
VTDRAGETVVVQRVLPATPAVVYDEWLDPEALAEFICPAPVLPGRIEVEPRVGGSLSIEMLDSDAVVTITGEYLELDRPRRLRFTWDSSYGGGFSSVVTVTLQPWGDQQTEMTIEHAQVPPAVRMDHSDGWGRIAAQLEAKVR